MILYIYDRLLDGAVNETASQLAQQRREGDKAVGALANSRVPLQC